MIKIDQRLKTIAELVKNDQAVVADIGTDHAYLPIYLIQSGRARYVYATDIGAGPLFNAQKDIAHHGLQTKIETRLGPGLVPIKKEDSIDTIVIAGMGGKLMAEIMEDANDLTQQVNYIFAPHASEIHLRKWLNSHNFMITDEKIIKEQGKIYEIIAAHKGPKPPAYDAADLLMGPLLRHEKNEIFQEKWTKELQKRLFIQSQQKESRQPVFSADLAQEIKLIEENL
ncbi:tRNA (adenine(22)-N(1))-methyltransferase [Xylocopilactobacillus apicola]|uniref:SAM-dependent methyltransferase n=1 Tax=Xylocopilactobacillus apicola TaxID=2932184 RepID=A0AAU9DJH4_9LACO|nr:tRNA (adenine(22)-N(1))-methyltransferase TrmK [Xylocopilactobacillus apicola]BDR58621.1 SAM-dependent methyltransferase [Xylocopilactobacillus apicola]